MTPLGMQSADSSQWGEFNPQFGFKTGVGGAHLARTLMLADLEALLGAAPPEAGREAFNRLIGEENVLGKRTTSNRRLTARHLIDLYGLDPDIAAFRLLRLFWAADPAGRPLLALVCAVARDALLRLSTARVLETRPGETLTSQSFADFFNQERPGRFSEAMIRSLARNVASSWAQAGFFQGKILKVRTRPVATPATAAYALVMGALAGLQGQLLIDSAWTRLLDVTRAVTIRLAQEAARRGWLDFKGVGNVFEVSFRQVLTPREIRTAHGSH